MNKFCPNLSLPESKALIDKVGLAGFYKLYIQNNYTIPNPDSVKVKDAELDALPKSVEVINNNLQKINQWWNNKSIDTNTFWKKVQELGIPKNQVELLSNSDGNSIGEKLLDFINKYSYTVEVNTSKRSKYREYDDDKQSYFIYDGYTYEKLAEYERDENDVQFLSNYVYFKIKGVTEEEALDSTPERITEEEFNKVVTESGVNNVISNSDYYSDLTVPGGINYGENEISTPMIIPAVKGHAQFATENGIGWFRSDDKAPLTFSREVDYYSDVVPTTRRILELQSDLFQKGRDKKDLVKGNEEFTTNQEIDLINEAYEAGDITQEQKDSYIKNTLQAINASDNQFLQLLNKDNNWVTFFIKSIIQDTAKKGYNKVLFPLGDTASKIEGHTTLEEFRKQKEDRIATLQYTLDTGLSDPQDQYKKDEEIQREINQLKQELERVEREGFAALRPIYNFYENVVSKIVEKQFKGQTNRITDEFGNGWVQVTLDNSNKNTVYYNIDSSLDNPIENQLFVNKDLFEAHQQDSIRDSFVYQINKIRTENPDWNLGQIREELRSILELDSQDNIDYGASNDDNDYLILGQNQLQVLQHFDRFWDLAQVKLSSMGINATITDIDIENGETEGTYDESETLFQKLNYSDESNFSQSSKDTASSRMKLLLSIIPVYEYENGKVVTDEDGNYVEDLNMIGLPRYEDLESIWNDMLYTLVDVPIGSKLDYLKQSTNPRHNIIYDTIVNNPNVWVQNEFESVFSKQQAKFVTVLLRRPDKDGFRTINVIDTNRSEPDTLLVTDWYNNFLNSKLITTDSNDNPVVNVENGIKLKEYYDKAVADWNTANIIKAFNTIGINISQEALDSEGIYVERNLVNPKKLITENGKFIFDRLAGIYKSETDSENALEANNPFDNEIRPIELLAKLENKVNPSIFESSFISGDGKAKYSFVNNTYASIQYRKLVSDPKYVSDLTQTAYASGSTWGQQLINNNTFRKWFSFNYVDTLGNDANNQTNKPFRSMNTTEKEAFRAFLFQNGGQGTSKETRANVGYFIGLTPSDKTTLPVFRTIKTNVQIDADLNFNQDSIDVMYDLFTSEYNRVKLTIAQNSDPSIIPIDSYHGKNGMGSKFIMFPFLNNVLFENEQLLELDDIRMSELVRPQLENFMRELTADQIRYWTELGIYNQDIFDKSYKTAKGYSNDNMDMHLPQFAADYAINQFVSLFNQTQLFSGDPALHGKTVLRDGGLMDTGNSINKTWINYFKRMAKDIAPGIDGNFKDSHFNTVFLKDLKYKSEHLAEYFKALGEVANDSYGKINPADAQEYTTIDEHLTVLDALGRLTEEIQEAADRLKDGGSEIRDINVIMQPMKPVYVEGVIANGINNLYYIKTSSFPLIPALTKGLEIDKLRIAMETNMDENGQLNPIGRAVYESGVKLGLKGEITQVSNNGGTSFNDISFSPEQIISLPRSGFRIQQEIPFHGEDTMVNEGSQSRKLILNNLLDTDIIEYNGKKITGREAKEIYERLHIEKMNRAFNALKDELGVDEFGRINNITKLGKILQEEARARDYPINDIYSIQVIKENGINKFKVPLSFNNNATRFESILNSLVTNRVIKSELPGFAKVQGSNVGFSKIVNDTNLDLFASSITWINPNDTKLNYITEKNGRLTGADILVPSYFKGIDIKDYILEDGSLDLNRIPEELLTIIGFRIPTQGYNSMMKFRVKGFLPRIMGDLAIVPSEITAQMGSDFDVDKLFMYNYHYNVNKDGSLSKISVELPESATDISYSSFSNKQIDNLIIQMFEDRLSDPKLLADILEPNGFGKLPDVAKDISKLSKDAKAVHNLSSRAQNNIYEINADGKMGTALFSLSSTFFKAAQDAKLTTNLFFKVKDSKGKVHTLNNLSNIYNIEDNKRSNVIMYLQSAAVDNSKEQILGVTNINDVTMNVAGTMAMLGYTEDYIAYFMSQPVIKEYVSKVKKNGSIITGGFDPNIHSKSINELMEVYRGTLTDTDKLKVLNSFAIGVDNLKAYLEQPNPNEGIEGLTNLTQEELNVISEINNVFQTKVLIDFDNLLELSQNIQSLQSALNPDTKGLGTNFVALEAKYDQIAKIRKSIIKDLAPLINNRAELFGDNFSGASVRVLQQSRDMYGSISAYSGPVYSEVVNNIVSGVNMNASETNLKSLYSDMKSFILSSGQFINSDDVKLIRDSLLFGQDNIAKRWDEYSKTPEGKKNKLTKRIKSKFARNKTDYNGLRANNTPASRSSADINNTIMYFYEMLNSDNTIERKLAEDLVRYFILTGASFGPNSIGKYITYDALEKYNFSKKLRDIDTRLISGDNSVFDGFIDQYFQNNPFKAHTVNLSSTANDSIVLQLNDPAINMSNDKVAAYIVSYDRDSNTPVLYKRIKLDEDSLDVIYQKLPLLSNNKLLKQYDADIGVTLVAQDIKRDQVPPLLAAAQDESGTPLRSDEIREDYRFNEGIDAILDVIILESNNAEYRKLANDIKRNNPNGINIQLEELTNINFNGSYSNNTVRINIDKISTFSNYNDKFEQVFLEELIHGLTIAPLDTDNSLLTTKQIAAKNKINRLYNEYVNGFADIAQLEQFKEIISRDASTWTEEERLFITANQNTLYPLTNVYEFVGQGLTKPEFRDTLKANNFWQRLIDFISNLLGLNTNDLDFLYSSTIDLLSDEQSDSDTVLGNIDVNENIASFVALRDEFFRAYRVKNYWRNVHKKYTAESQKNILESVKNNSKYDNLEVSFWNNELRVGNRNRVIPYLYNLDESESKPKSREDAWIDRIIKKYEQTIKDLKASLLLEHNEAKKEALKVTIEASEKKLDQLTTDRSVIKIVDSVDKRLKNIEKLIDNENPDWNQIADAMDYLKEFIIINQNIEFDDGSEVGRKYATKVNDIAGRASRTLAKLREKSARVVNDGIKERIDIHFDIEGGINEGITEVSGRESGNLDYSQSSNPHIQTIGYLTEYQQDKANDEHREFTERLIEVETAYKAKYKDNYRQLYQLDENGRPTEYLINKYQDEFYEKSRGNFDFWKKNVNVVITEADRKRYEEAKALVKENSFDDEYLNWVKDNNPDIFMDNFKKGIDFDWNGPSRQYVTTTISDAWIDPRYAALMAKGENDPAVQFYNFIEPLFRRLNKRYKSGQSNYIPELQQNTVDYFMKGNIKGGMSKLWDNFTTGLESDVYLNREELDPVTGEPRNRIPVRFFNHKLETEDRSTDLARIAEIVMYQELSNKVKHEIEPLLKIYYALIKDSKQNIGTDNEGNPILIDKEASKTSEQARFIINGWLYGLYRSSDQDEQKYGKYTDALISYIRLKGMAYNPFSAIGNIMQGLMSNFTFSYGSQYFSSNDYFKSTGVMLHSLAGRTDTAKKISKAFSFTDALVRHNEINFGMSRELKSARSTFSDASNAFILQQMGEYFVQGQTMVAVLSGEKVTNLKGETKSLWEAFDDNFKWKTEEFGDNPYNDRKKLFNLRMKIRKAIIDVHGNYSRPIQNKKHFYYRLLYTFRTWLPQAVTNRFGRESYDVLLNTRTKGRYRSLPGLWKTEDGKFSFEALKDNILYMIKLSGKTTLSEIDQTNMRKNLSELIMLSTLTALLLLLKSGMDDWDDDEKEVYTYLYNNLTRAQNDLLFFMNPAAMDAIIKDPVPAMSVIKDLGDTLDASWDTIMGEGYYKSGYRKDQPKLLMETISLIPIINQVPKNIGYMETVFERR